MTMQSRWPPLGPHEWEIQRKKELDLIEVHIDIRGKTIIVPEIAWNGRLIPLLKLGH